MSGKNGIQDLIGQARAYDHLTAFTMRYWEEAPARREAWANERAHEPADGAQELARLRGLMADTNSEYWRGPEAEANQERYRQLLSAQA